MESEQGLEGDPLQGRVRCKRLTGRNRAKETWWNMGASCGPPYSAFRYSSCVQWFTSSQPSAQPYISKSSVEFADKVAGIFIPTILSVAAITFVVWMTVGHIVDGSFLSPLYSATLAPQNLTLHLRHRPRLSLRSRTEYSNRRNGWDRCWRPERHLHLGWEGFGSKY